MKTKGNRLPSAADLREWLATAPGPVTLKAVAKAFGVKGALKDDLKRLMDEALPPKPRKEKAFRSPIGIYEVSDITTEGEVIARPLDHEGPELPLPDGMALSLGERFLGRSEQSAVRLIRRLTDVPDKVAGILRVTPSGARIVPLTKGESREWQVPEGMLFGAKDGELVEAEPLSKGSRMGLPRARVIARIGDPSAPKAVSLTAIWQHGIPDQFPADVLAEADHAALPNDKRTDLTHIPFLTIDPSDARDHDDAIAAKPIDGGFICYVAIADVAAFVRPGTALDREALKRGNSTYFPDRVVPMLPDRLSGDLCSLHEGVERPVLVAEIQIDRDGRRTKSEFLRATIRSRASLSYETAQGELDDGKGPHHEILLPLHDAWQALQKERASRQPLNLELPERKITLDDQGRVIDISFRPHLATHQLIEDFMILANVAVAEELIAQKRPQILRVHAEPDREKLKSLSDTAQASGMVLAKGQVIMTRHLNKLLAQADGTEFDELINMSVLRSMAQAVYSPDNIGHFGLALRNYAHFTSPIRRYSDLVTHRTLISALKLGEDGLKGDEDLQQIADHISLTERRSMLAERETTDRYLAAYMSERIGEEMEGRISGVQKFGCFVKLNDSGADGLVPVRSLGDEFFRFDARTNTLTGIDSGVTLAMGQRVTVKLMEAIPVTGGLMLEIIAVDGKPLTARRIIRRRGPVTRRRVRK
jgi:ribonuclease R